MNRNNWIKPLIITAILALILGIILIALLAGQDEPSAQTDDPSIVTTKENADYRYHLYSDGSIGIVAYLGTNQIITVPESVDGAPVLRIEDDAFLESSLTGIVLPETVISIGNRAFYGCEALISLTMPDSVKTVGKDAFLVEKNGAASFIPWVYSRDSEFVTVGDGILIAYIGSAPKDMVIPKGVKHISRFYFNTSAIQSVTLPKTLVSIGDSAFENFTSIQKIEFPSSLTELGNRAFYNCKALTELTLPASVKRIGNESFACCPKLQSAAINGASIIGDSAFAYCLGLKSVTLPQKGLTSIGAKAFTDCSNLMQIVIPDSVTSLGAQALHATAWMNSKKNETFVVTDNGMLVAYNGAGGQITVEDSAIKVIVDAFSGRTDITGVILGNSVTEIAPGAFENCSSLSAFVASKYLKIVGERAFAGCTALTQADLLDGVSTIGNHAFTGCTSLAAIILPKNLKTIPLECFAGCDALLTVTLPDALQTVEANAFGGCPLERVNYNGTSKQKAKITVGEGNAVFSALFGA